MADLTELIRLELNKTVGDLIAQYKKLGLKASGEYEKSLDTFLVERGDNIRAGITGAQHAIQMEQGRGPNKRQDRGMIAFIYVKLLQWMKDKGVKDINPWMAARKIVREGIKVPNRYNAGGVVTGVVNPEWLDELSQKILAVQNEDILDAVLSDLKDIAQ